MVISWAQAFRKRDLERDHGTCVASLHYVGPYSQECVRHDVSVMVDRSPSSCARRVVRVAVGLQGGCNLDASGLLQGLVVGPGSMRAVCERFCSLYGEAQATYCMTVCLGGLGPVVKQIASCWIGVWPGPNQGARF